MGVIVSQMSKTSEECDLWWVSQDTGAEPGDDCSEAVRLNKTE